MQIWERRSEAVNIESCTQWRAGDRQPVRPKKRLLTQQSAESSGKITETTPGQNRPSEREHCWTTESLSLSFAFDRGVGTAGQVAIAVWSTQWSSILVLLSDNDVTLDMWRCRLERTGCMKWAAKYVRSG